MGFALGRDLATLLVEHSQTLSVRIAVAEGSEGSLAIWEIQGERSTLSIGVTVSASSVDSPRSLTYFREGVKQSQASKGKA
jgi:hypothetical protein